MRNESTPMLPTMPAKDGWPTPPKSRFPVLHNLLYGRFLDIHPMTNGVHTFIVDEFFSGNLSLWDGSLTLPLLEDDAISVDTILGIPSIPPFPVSWVEWGNGTAAYVNRSHDGSYTIMGVMNTKFENAIFAQIGLAWARIEFGDDGVATDEVSIFPVKDWENYGLDIDLVVDGITGAANMVSAFFMFTHCKNVTVKESLPKRHEARAAKRNGQIPVKYHHIVIDPQKTKTVSPHAGRGDDRPKKALHLARGHFAHYTEDKPLFGKYVGTFWRPAHVRGSADVGTVYKDYKVKP